MDGRVLFPRTEMWFTLLLQLFFQNSKHNGYEENIELKTVKLFKRIILKHETALSINENVFESNRVSSVKIKKI